MAGESVNVTLFTSLAIINFFYIQLDIFLSGSIDLHHYEESWSNDVKE